MLGLLLLQWTTLPAQAQPASPSPTDSGSPEWSEVIRDLNSSNYRVRRLARWRLSKNTEQALPAIREALATADHHSGIELIELVSQLALRGGSDNHHAEAMSILFDTSERLTSVGVLANNSLSAISELHEGQALEILIHHGAIIGPRDFSLNGTKGMLDSEIALHITEDFSGDESAIRWIQYLSSVETVCLEGSKVNRAFLEVVMRMKNLRNLKLKSCSLTLEDIALLKNIDRLDHFGLLYSELGDELLSTLIDLPVGKSIKLYGTRVSEKAGEELKTQLNDLEIFIGNGGFLGVAPIQFSTRIAEVTRDSAAQKAGILGGDEITHINDRPVKTFPELRSELGKYRAGEAIQIRLVRRGIEREVKAVLQKE